MVSDPEKQKAAPAASSSEAAPVTLAGFSSAAHEIAPDSVAETERRKSWMTQLSDYINEWRAKRKEEPDAGSLVTGPLDPYKKFWFRHGLGDQVFDCGDCMHMSATKDKPVTQKQIERMVLCAIKDKNWDTLYMFDKKGKPDLQMAQAVQGVINHMRAEGKIAPDCKITCCTDQSKYPATLKDFYAMAKDMFNTNAQADNPAEQRPGITAHARPGLHGAAPA